jgi:glycine/D-amino acid oxidase-like deaminating enzyme
MRRHSDRALTEVLVVGDGIIGLSAAAELARRGASVLLAGAKRPGIASEAAAGLLAPSIGGVNPAAMPFYLRSLALFPEFVAALSEEREARLLTHGLIEVIDPESPVTPTHARAKALSSADVASMEPSIVAHTGAWYHPDDGAVHLPNLVAALRRVINRARNISTLRGEVTAIGADARHPAALMKDGTTVEADMIVLAAGAWTPGLRGLPRELPVRPLKGEIIALDRCPLRYPVLAGHVYLVPRGDETVVGATAEDIGFDVHRNSFVASMLHKQAAAVCPVLEAAQVSEHWAGLRPATPDMMPIIGRDPDVPSLVYACGHGRNGILLAPATAAAVADVCLGDTPEVSLDPFSVTRFSTAAR